MVAKLRCRDIRAELYLGTGKLGAQMKYADRRNAPCVVIQGSDEKAKGEVTIKDLIVGAELAKLEKGREEHLQKQAEAQRSVPEAESRRGRPQGPRAPRTFLSGREPKRPRGINGARQSSSNGDAAMLRGGSINAICRAARMD